MVFSLLMRVLLLMRPNPWWSAISQAGPTERVETQSCLMYAQFYMFGGQKDTEVKREQEN
jgi:hypothetical protein